MLTPAFSCEVLVVGAGPAGSSAAFHLAKQGIDVLLLDRAVFPRDKACGDGLMAGALYWLQHMGVDSDSLAPRVIRGASMIMADRGIREYDFPAESGRALVVPRSVLDHMLLQRAVAAGAAFRGGVTVTTALVSRGSVVGVVLRHGDGHESELRAQTVIAADGSSSVIARSVGLQALEAHSQGIAVRAYFTNVAGLEDQFRVYLPLLSPDRRRRLSGYGWVFPLPGDVVNVGVGLLPGSEPAAHVHVRRLFECFIADLRVRDTRFAHMAQRGPLRGGRLNCGFVPARTAGPGLFLVGDAAGLVDPFTGEGIQWALESGALAAELIAEARSFGPPSVTHYSKLLESRYRERFTFGRRFLNTQAFAWRLLEETFHSEEPLFKQFRRAMLDFGSQGLPFALEATVPAPARENVPTTPAFFAAVGRDVDRALARQFPLVARIARSWVTHPDGLSRITTYWNAARGGDAAAPAHVQGAACVELAHLGYLALQNVQRSQPSDRALGRSKQETKWPNAFAVMMGDFLLAKAYAVAAQLGPGICGLLARVSASICAAEAAVCNEPHSATHFSAHDYLVGLPSRAPALHAFACNVACELAAVPPAMAAMLASFGTSVGMASHLAAEAREFSHLEESACTVAIASRLSRGAWSLPLLLAADTLGVDVSAARSASRAPSEIARAIADVLQTGPIIQNTLDEAWRFVQHAKAQLAALPPTDLRGEMLAASDSLVPAIFASPPTSSSRQIACLPSVDLRATLLSPNS